MPTAAVAPTDSYADSAAVVSGQPSPSPNDVPFPASGQAASTPTPSPLQSLPSSEPYDTGAVGTPLGSGPNIVDPVAASPVPPPEQTAKNLMDAVSNPLGVPQSKAVQPPDPEPAPASTQQQTSSFLPEAQPSATSATSAPQASFLPEANQSTSQSFLPEAQQSTNGATATPAQPDPEQGFSTQMQQQEQQIRALSAKYNHDPETAMEEMSKDNTVDPEKALQAIQFAQKQQDGEGSYYSDFDKLLDSYVNGAKAVGNFINGIYQTVTHPLAIPNQIGSTVNKAIQDINPLGEGPNQLQPLPQSGPVSALGQPNTPLTSSDMIRPQIKTADMTPADKALYDTARNNESQQAQRTLVAGGQEGAAQNLQLVEQAVNTALGIYVNSPISSWIHAVGGPEAPVITPEQQVSLMLQKTPIPLRSAQSVNTMDPDALRSEFMTRRMQNNLSLARQAGYVSPSGESFLDTFNNGKAKTVEQLKDAGYPMSPTEVNDVAGTTNLALSVPEFALLDGILGVTGAKSLMGTVAGYGLQGAGALTEATADAASLPFDLASGAASKTADFLNKNPKFVGFPVTEALRGFIQAHTGIELPGGEIGEYMLSKPIGKLATPLVSGPLKALGTGLGWGSKLLQGLSEPVSDWLSTGGSDLVNDTDMLATRSPVGNFLGNVAKNAAVGGAETYPIAYASSPNNPEQQDAVELLPCAEVSSHASQIDCFTHVRTLISLCSRETTMTIGRSK